jgi:hypothetical protein
MRKAGIWIVVLFSTLAAGACKRNDLLGEYEFVHIEKSLAAIERVPDRVSKELNLTEYREWIRKSFSGKTIKFSSDEPHSFLVPVPYEGSVDGIIRGAWMRDEHEEMTTNVYQWVSGSMYHPWGRVTFKADMLTLTLLEHGANGPVLYLRKKND